LLESGGEFPVRPEHPAPAKNPANTAANSELHGIVDEAVCGDCRRVVFMMGIIGRLCEASKFVALRSDLSAPEDLIVHIGALVNRLPAILS
jgi:hypothetical protein